MGTELVSRLIVLVVFAIISWQVTDLPDIHEIVNILPLGRIIIIVVFGVIGFIAGPYITIRPMQAARRWIRQIDTQSLLAGTIGLVIGLLISMLLAVPISFLPSPFGKFIPGLVALVLGYLGVTTSVQRQREILSILGPRFQRDALEAGGGKKSLAPLLLDTSVIIDGRIADICQTGFLIGTLVVPRFVLNELQHIADSPDALRRNRGRRGLDILNKLQRETPIPLEITDADPHDIKEVDGKLIKLATTLKCPVITNDYNLNRVAELQGVSVLNINKLANAVKAVVLPGETIKVRIIQEGKEAGQGVGYLDDGTMVVVENGRRYLNSTLEVTVTRVLQTIAGRMIFAQSNGTLMRN